MVKKRKRSLNITENQKQTQVEYRGWDNLQLLLILASVLDRLCTAIRRYLQSVLVSVSPLLLTASPVSVLQPQQIKSYCRTVLGLGIKQRGLTTDWSITAHCQLLVKGISGGGTTPDSSAEQRHHKQSVLAPISPLQLLLLARSVPATWSSLLCY